MDIERFDLAADHEAARVCHEIYLAGVPDDDPLSPPMSLPVFAGWLAEGWTEAPSQTWLVRDKDGSAIGWCALRLPERENRHLAEVSPAVHPAFRRAGTGARLIAHTASIARDEGRTLLVGETRDGSPGAAFARALGARPGIPETRRLLSVADLPDGHLAALRAQAEPAARGYELLRWAGPVPAEEVDAMVRVLDYENDAPRDASREGMRWDADRVRRYDQRAAAQGLRRRTVAARDIASGELAGFTAIEIDPLTPGWAFQALTVVAEPHRGHRLGLLMKVAMLELITEREPGVRQVITGNADSNQHMIAINTALGFRPLERWRSWELPAAAALTLPAASAQS